MLPVTDRPIILHDTEEKSMAKMTMTTTTTAPARRRLKFQESVSGTGWAYIAGQVADVPGPLATELLRIGQATETAAAIRTPIWSTCARCGSSWHAWRVGPDGRRVMRFSDDADQTLYWTECRCGYGYLR
jgi:hypothetical protein